MAVYVPAVKQGRTKKLASFWRGPYTVIDRLNAAVNYRRIYEDIGSAQESSKTMLWSSQREREGRSNGSPQFDTAGCDFGSCTETHDGGYVEAGNVNDEGMMDDIQPQLRPQRIRRPPDRYGIYVEH